MATRLMDNVYVKGGYLDSNVSVTSLSDLIDKYDFDGQSIHMPEAFLSTDGVSYPVDFWYVPNGDDIKWEIKNIPAISSAEDFERFKIFCDEFKNLSGYYPLANGGEVLVDGFIYSLSFDENGNPNWIDKQAVLDETISDAITTAVDEITSGASEAFDTLKEIEEWIKANSGSTAVGMQGPQGAQGADGAQGPQGAVGAAGNDGAEGPQGAQGPQGAVGAAGKDGADGVQGPQGAVGAAGNDGAEGPQGAQGAQGPQGADGANGADGAQGPQGADGANGADGAQGPQGADGANGADGAQGPQGADGANGADGAQGPQGAVGAAGNDGAQGPQGAVGANGADGAQGPQGAVGAAGNDGAQGPQGAVGANGAEGPQGAQGVQGADGAQGPQGADGANGADGAQGPQGADGKDGKDGTSVTILGSKASESELPMDGNSNGDGYIIEGYLYVWDGNKWNNVGEIKGPQGETGAVGAQGPQGADGANGNDGAQGPQGADGANGADGAQGPQGADGANGADGAQGPQGADGANGADGAQGPQGAVGAAGNDGAQGPQGADGADGANGADGAQGPQGADGANGADGAQGPQGADGANGADGAQGPQGAVGAAGNDGAQGPQGADGAQGPQGADGADGANGADGAQGPQGEKGALDEEEVIALKNEVYNSAITFTNDEISKLVGNDSGKTIRDIASEELASQLIPENAQESLDTLEEIAAWIQAHPDDAAAMNSSIVTLSGMSHTHDNKTALDEVTSEKIAAWDAAEQNAKDYADGLAKNYDAAGAAESALTEAKEYTDELVENLKPYTSGIATDITDYTVNVKVADNEKNFLDVNENNELEVKEITLDAAKTSKDIVVEGGQWASAVKTVYGGSVPAGTTWESFLEAMLCVEKFDTTFSMSKTFNVSCGTLGKGITGASNNSSVEVGTKVSLNAFTANNTTASQSFTVSTFDYGYKLGEDGTYTNATSYKETLTPTLKTSNDTLTATFTNFVDESGNTIDSISKNSSIDKVDMRVMDGSNKVVIAQTGDTYTSSSAVTAGTIYVATNLKNYYKADKETINTYTPSVASEDKTATASTTYTVTGYRNTFYGTTSSSNASDVQFIRSLTKSGKAISAGNTLSISTKSSDGHVRMVIASPREISTVKNATATQDLTALLVGTKKVVEVGGVDNFAPISYNVYDYTWKGAFGNDTWIITFA